MRDPGCVFCAIVSGTADSSRVFEDEHVLAFMDIRPITAGHLLVVPTEHAEHLADLDEEHGAAMFRAGHRLAAALRRSGLPCEGINLFLADGAVAGQEVPHAHLHVIPRTRGDNLRITAQFQAPSRQDLDSAAARVRDGLPGAPG
jgi:histidine triad (HIT) family protein